ncbi:hypothetical protein P8841_09180 [Bacillus spizizenii]|nr:hypothetical protein [Bacillus spizizenii]
MKPHVTTFAFSEDTQDVPNQFGNGSSKHIINPRNLIRPPFLPATPSFSVSVGVAGIDPNRENTFSFKISGPDQQLVLDSNDFSLPKNPQHDKSLPDEANGFFFNFNLRDVPLKVKGKYTAEIYINKEKIGEFALYVFPQGE